MGCVQFDGAIVMFGGLIREIVDLNGRVWRFEAHDVFGPAVVGKRGEVLSVQPGSRSPFWVAANAWYEQGQRLDTNGRCVYDPPPPEPKLLHLGGRNYCEDTPANRKKFAKYIRESFS